MAKSKKRGAKPKPSDKRAVKDLPARKGSDVRGGGRAAIDAIGNALSTMARKS
jgi:hypothetical protein